MKTIIILLAVVAIITIGAAGFAWNRAAGMAGVQGAVSSQPKYVCPMHPDVRFDAPGKCPKCGMNLIAAGAAGPKAKMSAGSATSPEEMLNRAGALIDDAKKALASGGKYSCCLDEPCDECALGHKSCNCAMDLKAGKGVCSQCYGGWQRGDGAIDGVDPKSVKGNFHSHEHGH